MLIPSELISTAKEKLGEKAAFIIADNLQLKGFDKENLKAICFNHNEDTPSMIWNPKNNCFHCFGCNFNYGILDHYMSFHKLTYLEAVERLFKETETPFRFGEKGVKTKREYKYPFYDKAEDRTEVEKYLGSRKITKDVLNHLDIQQDDKRNIVFNFYDTNDVLCLVKYRPARMVKDGENKSWCQKDSDTKPILFNMNRVDPSKPLIITEGEIDCASVIQAGYSNCVSIPFGAQSMGWIEENFDWLNQFEKIICWFDNDVPGINARKEACSRLGIWRTLFVTIPEELFEKLEDKKKKKLKDANSVLVFFDEQTVLQLINDAEEVPIVGIEDMADTPEFNIENEPGLYTRIQPIDDTVYKFLFGNVIIVTGIRGAGKSTLLNQCFVCEPLDQGHDVFVFSGELNPPILKSWIELSMAGPEKVKMKDQFIHVIDPQAKKDMRDWYSGRIWIYKDMSNKYEDILQKAITVTRKYGVKVWILDNLSCMDLSANDNNLNEKQKDFIVNLTHQAAIYGVLAVLVIHPRKIQTGQELVSDDINGNGALANLAQYLVSVKRFSKKEKAGERDGRGNFKKGKEPIDEDVEIDIMKNRHTGKVSKERLFFNYASYRFFSNAKELFRRYKWDKDSKRPIPSIVTVEPRFKEQLPPQMDH
jgi:KaiC/GvpD/RAD55 family RecA-like ATPase